MKKEIEYIDLWLVERILQENNYREVCWLQDKLNHGLKIKNQNGRYVTSNLEILRRRLNDSKESHDDGEMFLETG